MENYRKCQIIFLLLAIAAYGQLLTDNRDGNKYKTVVIGEQTWMAENLNYDASGSKCYNDSTAYCDKYGRLYNWETAEKSCPNGWHLPTNAEWDKLSRFADGTNGTSSPYESKTAGKFLKATRGWNSYQGKSGNGTDDFGFAALPGGYGYSDGYFNDGGEDGNWWSASDDEASFADGRGMSYDYDYLRWSDSDKHGFFFSVRCVKD